VGRTGIREGEGTDPLDASVVNRGSASGFSDVTFLGQYRFFNNKSTQTEVAVLFGVRAPTGVTNRVDKQGELFDAEFQPGSGAWSGLFGLAATRRFGSWSLDSNVLQQIGNVMTCVGFETDPAPSITCSTVDFARGSEHVGADTYV
jgi:hypothetical protein